MSGLESRQDLIDNIIETKNLESEEQALEIFKHIWNNKIVMANPQKGMTRQEFKAFSVFNECGYDMTCGKYTEDMRL